MKILLIQPSQRDCVKTLFSIYNAKDGIGFKPPIGLLSVATAVKQMACSDVEVLDCQLDDIHSGNILNFVKDEYDVIGISAWTDFWYQAVGMARELKQKYPHSHIVMGGPHVNIYPKEVLRFSCVDSIVVGDGEIPMVELVENIAKERNGSKDIQGVYYRDIDYGEFVPFLCSDLDSLPIPDRTLLPIERYYSVLGPNKFATTMITSRGCPYRCIYCKLDFQRPVMRSAANVIKEFEIINKIGIREVEVYDDTFNWDHQRTRDICKGLIGKGLSLQWAIRDRVDRVKEDILIEMKKAGCYRIHLGVESGNDTILKSIKKGITTSQVREAVRLVKKHNFTTLTYFMYGLPGEMMVDAEKTLNFALELDSDYAEFSIMIPYPGTEAYRGALKEKIIPVDYWLDFTRSPSQSFEIPCVIENLMSRQEMLRLRDRSIKKFYFRIGYILKELKKIKNWRDFVRKFTMGLGLFDLIRE